MGQHSQLNNILAELRAGLESLYGERLLQLILYGSQARGDAEDYSDIDVLVVLTGIVNPSAEIDYTGNLLVELSLKYNTVIACLFIDEPRFQDEKSPLLLNIHREGAML
jgi:uncharacterized protein